MSEADIIHILKSIKKTEKLTVKKPRRPEIVPSPGYYPSLEKMTPEQRWIYYEWYKGNIEFTDIKEYKDSRISYVFVYLWEIEKWIKEGKYEKAKKEIERLLEKYSNNHSFLCYAINDILLISEYQNKDLEAMQFILKYYNFDNPSKPITYFHNHVLNLKARTKSPFEGKELLFLAKIFVDKKNFQGKKILFRYNKFTEKYFEKIAERCQVKLDEFKRKENEDLLQYIAKRHVDKKGWVYYSTKRVFKLIFFDIPEFLFLIKKIAYDAENEIRDEMGLRPIGEGWISESLLFHRIKKLFPDKKVYHNAHEKWLGRQHLDIYIPDLKVALEYQGEQHFRPIDFFGGELAHKKLIDLDKRKRMLSKKNNVSLVYMRFDDEYTDDELRGIILNLPIKPNQSKLTFGVSLI